MFADVSSINLLLLGPIEGQAALAFIGAVCLLVFALRHACDVASTILAILVTLVEGLAKVATELREQVDSFATACADLTARLSLLAWSCILMFRALLPLALIATIVAIVIATS